MRKTGMRFIAWCVSGVEVLTAHSRSNTNQASFKADAVLCTLPLGVLKETLRSNSVNSVQFMPPLPEWKLAAVQRLGFGNLNKVHKCVNKIATHTSWVEANIAFRSLVFSAYVRSVLRTQKKWSGMSVHLFVEKCFLKIRNLAMRQDFL